jgi:hypothetical protein
MGTNPNESGYKLGGNIAPRARDHAVLPVLEKRFMWPGKKTGLFVEVSRTEPTAKRGLLGGVVYTAAVHRGSPTITGPHLVHHDSDPTIGKGKARKATRAGRKLGEAWLGRTSDREVRELIASRKPRVYGGRQ